MDVKKETPEQSEFRDHCRRWLRENRPPALPSRLPEYAIEVMLDEHRRYLCDWQKKCYQAGLVACDYPKEYGGGGHSGFQRIASQEMSNAGVPYLINVIGLGMAAPTILHHGTEEQKRCLLPPLFAADEIWCQGFSEPNAGSDLASAQTFAQRDGDNWVINGHKVWTSLAHFAKWMIILCRTSHDDKYKGLTYFVTPIADTKGVTVRPLIKITGQTGFNEVLFDDVIIPDAYRLDQVGNGWQVAMTTLLHERGAAEGAGGGGGEGLEERTVGLVRLAKKIKRNGKPAWEDAALRDRIVQILIRAEGMRQTHRRARVPALTEHPMRIPLQGKLLISELMQDAAALGLEIEGAHASLYLGDGHAPDGASWPLAYLNSYGITIAAGTSEVQRNILGERVLGLAKSK
ncbi:MAG: acyl-CoA dehydrogenase family protein [Deltaproteobacteria bacterium]|nr:acyl-CoA dehydrogenase family protein [Deltaproteobacteria bacterium]